MQVILMKKLYLAILFLFMCLSFTVNAQNDTIKKKTTSFQIGLDQRKSGDGIVIGKEIKGSPFLDMLNKKEDKPLKNLDYYLNLGTTKPKQNLMTLSNKPKVDDDVLVKRSFGGKDTSDPKLESHANLGTVESSTKFVRIEFADYGLVDGDRVRIYLNEKIVEKNITLTGVSAFIELKMKKGYNRIDFSALNQGYAGPNTAAFMVYDDKGKLVVAKAWNLKTNENATLSVIRY